MTDEEFLAAFEQCTLPEGEWTHRAHVRMAWLYLRQGDLAAMLPVVRRGIQRYNATLNKHLGYHETITCGFLILIGDCMRRGEPSMSFETFCAENPLLLDCRLTALLAHYRRETLFSAAAREDFLSPDLRPLPGVGDELRPGGLAVTSIWRRLRLVVSRLVRPWLPGTYASGKR